MKKILIVIIALVLSFLLFWGGSCIYFEVLTSQHGEEFTELYKLSNMIDEVDHLKVMKYSDTTAKVYYVTENTVGDLFTFIKQNGEWELEKWETVWSKSGSADGFIWPYIR